MKKKLLIFHPTIAPYRVDFFNDLSKAFDTRICLRYQNLRSQTFDYNKIASQFVFSPIYQKELFKIGKRGFSNGFWKNLNIHNPDIVLVEEFSFGTIMVLLHRFIYRKKYKVLSICDDSYNMVAENNDFSKIHKFLRHIVVPMLDGMILVEPKVTDWYQKYFQKGFCFPIIKSDENARNEYQRVLPQSNQIASIYHLFNKKIFLFVGRLVALKNVDSIIRAFSKLNQKEHVLVIIGDGNEKERLRQLSFTVNANVIFTGRLEGDTLNAWYNIANIFILASYQEPFGAVTNEALLAGCYSIVSNKAGSACLIKEHVNGYTFNPMDENELYQKMQKVSMKINPLSKIVLKENLMKINFKCKMEELIAYLYKL